MGAATLLRRYGTLEKALAAGRFPVQSKQLRLFRSIATMNRKAPVPALRDQKPTWANAAVLAKKWQLTQLAKRLRGAGDGGDRLCDRLLAAERNRDLRGRRHARAGDLARRAGAPHRRVRKIVSGGALAVAAIRLVPLGHVMRAVFALLGFVCLAIAATS
jgi:hypothetical protein